MLSPIKYILFLLTIVFLSQSLWAQFTIPNQPRHNEYVYDYTALLSESQKRFLQNKLYQYEDSTSTQIVIAIIDDLEGEDISMLGTKWAHSWGIGGKKEDNGIFILLKKDKEGPGGEIDIATGYGIEYRMTDRMSKQIINRIIIPNFRQQKYFEGLDEATDAIISILDGEFEGEGISKKERRPSFIPIFFILVLLILIFSSRNKGGKGGGRKGASPSLLDVLILGSMGRSSGGNYRGGGFGSGSFGGGFGGGGFGGGGASGRW